MTSYRVVESGRLPSGLVCHKLYINDMLVRDDMSVDHVDMVLREVMKPGDTLQEFYESSGRKTDVFSYEDMQYAWKREDEFKSRNNLD